MDETFQHSNRLSCEISQEEVVRTKVVQFHTSQETKLTSISVVKVFASKQCDPGSIPEVDAICGLSFVFLGTPVFLPLQKPTFPNSNSTWNTRLPLNKFL